MDRVQEQYIARRKKEDLSFLVIRFMQAYVLFHEIITEFEDLQLNRGGFEHAGLFEKVKELEEKLVFDIKEKAHFLFRSPTSSEQETDGVTDRFADLEKILLVSQDEEADKQKAKQVFSALRRSLVSKSIDSYIGTGFHLFMILRESVYQLEFYVPEYLQELEYLTRIDYLTKRIGYEYDEEEEHELAHIRQVVKLCQSIATDTKELAAVALQRCKSLFQETKELLRHTIEESGSNEILVLNLLKERNLVEQVYGPGSCAAIANQMFRFSRIEGNSGIEKAVHFVKQSCGNVEAIDPAIFNACGS